MTVFHDTPPPWFESVKDLAPGAKRRLGDGMLASFNGKAYHRWDFREKTSEVYEPKLSLAEKLAILAQMAVAQDAALQSNDLPGPRMDHPADWPVDARVWLHKAGLDNTSILHMGAYWNPDMQRVVLPYSTFDGRHSWVARSTSKSPKYLNPLGGVRSGGAYYASPLAGRVLVLTEDMLSAYRVFRADTGATGWNSLAVMGTSLDKHTVQALTKRYSSVTLWLDGDEWGKKGARKIESEFSRLDFPVRRITTPQDPKLYTDAEIRSILEDRRWRT